MPTVNEHCWISLVSSGELKTNPTWVGYYPKENEMEYVFTDFQLILIITVPMFIAGMILIAPYVAERLTRNKRP